MMMLSTLILVLTLVHFVEACPINCICEVTETLCNLKSCSDQISLDYTDYLVIDGKLCEDQRRLLNSLTPNTIIVLKSDRCEGIRKCRLIEKYLNFLSEN